MKIEYKRISVLILYAFLFFIMLRFGYAAIDTSSPLGFNGSNNASNRTYAYDSDFGTFALFNASKGNLSYFNFDIGVHIDKENIFQIDVWFDIYVSGFSDDTWGLQYSDDNGTTFYDLRLLSSDALGRQNLTYYDIIDYNDNNWSWSTLKSTLKIRVLGDVQNNPDAAGVRIYEAWANVSYDVEEPAINTTGPANNSEWQLDSWVWFLYEVNDNTSVKNCSLIINDTVNDTHTNPALRITHAFNVSFANVNFTWAINCTDLGNYQNTTGNYSVFVNANREPEIENVSVLPDVTLSPGGRTWVVCNVSTYDLDGETNIDDFEAKLYHSSKEYSDADNFSVHYTNTSCELYESGNNYRNYTCGFRLWYYAWPGEWYCNGTVTDRNTTMNSNYTSTTVGNLWAYDITPLAIRYGTLGGGENSTDDNVTIIENTGNKELDISLFGYGYEEGDGNSLNCSTVNISIDYERYSLTPDLSYEVMTKMTTNPVTLSDFNLQPRTNAFNGQKNIYFKVGIPVSISNVNCSGVVIFEFEQG
ncbi:MAG: hypothetical protein KKG59_07995 [Nanoarchaeota archaeon]|nr:hypothetical protein [Nanoarchaeota archaeon]